MAVYNLIKAYYTSTVSWEQEVDYLRCSPSFHNQERHDGVLFKTVDGFAFGTLLLVLICRVGTQLYPVCVIRRREAYRRTTAKDRELGFCRIRARPEDQVSAYEFIFVCSIVRGALLIEDHERELESLVFDILDEDIFLRCRDIFPQP